MIYSRSSLWFCLESNPISDSLNITLVHENEGFDIIANSYIRLALYGLLQVYCAVSVLSQSIRFLQKSIYGRHTILLTNFRQRQLWTMSLFVTHQANTNNIPLWRICVNSENDISCFTLTRYMQLRLWPQFAEALILFMHCSHVQLYRQRMMNKVKTKRRKWRSLNNETIKDQTYGHLVSLLVNVPEVTGAIPVMVALFPLVFIVRMHTRSTQHAVTEPGC